MHCMQFIFATIYLLNVQEMFAGYARYCVDMRTLTPEALAALPVEHRLAILFLQGSQFSPVSAKGLKRGGLQRVEVLIPEEIKDDKKMQARFLEAIIANFNGNHLSVSKRRGATFVLVDKSSKSTETPERKALHVRDSDHRYSDKAY